MPKAKLPNWLKKYKGKTPALGGHDPADLIENMTQIAEEDRQACIMEATNLISPKYETWGTDAPCVDSGLTGIAIEANDNIQDDDKRAKLLSFAPRFLGTAYKKHQKAIRLAIEEWANSFVKRNRVLSYENFYYGEPGDEKKPYPLKRKDFKTLYKATQTASYVINAWEEQRTPDNNKYANELIRFFNEVLPEGELVEPNWDRARDYFEKGILPGMATEESLAAKSAAEQAEIEKYKARRSELEAELKRIDASLAV